MERLPNSSTVLSGIGFSINTIAKVVKIAIRNGMLPIHRIVLQLNRPDISL